MFKLLEKFFLRSFRHKMAESSVLNPPDTVLRMTVWKPELFNKTVEVPYLDIPVENLSKLPKKLKDKLLKIPNYQPIQQNGQVETSKRLILHPDIVTSFDDLGDVEKEILKNQLGVEASAFGKAKIDLTVENYLPLTMLRAVLKLEDEGLSSHSHVGHIIHVNLKDHLLPYKNVIGQILLRRKDVRLVVNKTSNIDNTFRNFQMEVIAQRDADLKDEDFIVEVRENGVRYKFDFSKVYWNPRLSTEHQNMVNLLTPGDLVFDVFAGVGPFSVPAAKKSMMSKNNSLYIKIFANDLNPASYEWLKFNFRLNKIPEAQFECFNKDGKDFILQDIKSGIIDFYMGAKTDRKVHILMNLPALGIDFLSYFDGILFGVDTKKFVSIEAKSPPFVHVYCFSNVDDIFTDVRERCAKQFENKELINLTVEHVRSVAPHKEMMRASFQLSMEVMTHESCTASTAKKPKMDSEN